MMATGTDADAGRHTSSIALELHRDENAPGIARAATADLCETVRLTGARCQTLLLLVSEIVTNAVIHSKAPAGIPIRFAANADHDYIRIDVHDSGPDFIAPSPRTHAQQHGGWGLHLVDREARNWGIDRANGTRVWFELTFDSCAATSNDPGR